MDKIYLDFNASTPIAPEVAAAMQPYVTEHFGNPSSMHWAGQPARAAVEMARGYVAELLGASVDEIVFTSGGSEANNHAILGAYFRARTQKPHFITSSIEHPAVLEPMRFLERLGARVTYLPVDSAGMIDPGDVKKAITRDTVLISVMHANNEVGTIEPIEEMARAARERGVLFHTDAAQTVGKLPCDVGRLGVDLLTVAGHKLYAPKGVGAIYIRNGVEIEPLVHGAGHEHGRRAGTENVLLTVGLGAAARLASTKPFTDSVRSLRDWFWQKLVEAFSDQVVLNGHPTDRLPNTINVSFVNRIGHEVLAKLEGVAASTGSACHAGAHQMSPVLAVMGIRPNIGLGAVRFSLGRTSTRAEIETVVERLRQSM
jgi:cysteine desulfurase